MIKEGDIVTRKKYGNDLNFIVKSIEDDGTARLYCISHRLFADAPLDDLKRALRENFFIFKKLFRSDAQKKVEDILKKRKEKMSGVFYPGRVLHIDSDEGFLNMCMSYYDLLGVPASGRLIVEDSQPLAIMEVLKEDCPDILILTGHDSLKNNSDETDMGNYSSSGFFADAVKKARQFQSGRDSLIIFAGACQSNFEAIMSSGANFASSPERKLIHALDPVFIGERLSYTSVFDIVTPKDALENTMTSFDGLGGFETRGTLRGGNP
ncbi:MAG: sporulation peptidase YabG [Lachnospiraceae bacterium]|nr:sporulation peptidase YabG [Lachnospiraceae bacterium]